MNIQLENSFFKVKAVHSMHIQTEKSSSLVKVGIWPWNYEEQVKKLYVLTVKYINELDEVYVFTSKCDDYAETKKSFDSVMTQIKNQDSQYADKLLEDAIISGGNGETK